MIKTLQNTLKQDRAAVGGFAALRMRRPPCGEKEPAPSVGFADISPCQGESALRGRRFFDSLENPGLNGPGFLRLF